MKPKKSATRVRRKTWYTIIAPKLFNNQVLGESCVFDQRQLLGRKLRVNLMSLSGDPKKQNINIDFKITDLQGNKVKAEIVGYSMIASSIKRYVRRGATRIDETLICETSDNKKLKIKLFLLTRVHVKSSREKQLRKLLIESIVASVKKYTYEKFFDAIITYKLQRSVRQTLNKISPLRVCEVRSVTIASEKEAAKKLIKQIKVKPATDEKEKSVAENEKPSEASAEKN